MRLTLRNTHIIEESLKKKKFVCKSFDKPKLAKIFAHRSARMVFNALESFALYVTREKKFFWCYQNPLKFLDSFHNSFCYCSR